MEEQPNEEEELKKYEYLSRMILSKATEHLGKFLTSTSNMLEMFDSRDGTE
jgi:hypothetical protein